MKITIIRPNQVESYDCSPEIPCKIFRLISGLNIKFHDLSRGMNSFDHNKCNQMRYDEAIIIWVP